MYPKIILDLIDDLKRLPGIGQKTAERLAIELISWKDDLLINFSDHLKNLKQNIRYCTICGLLTDKEVCNICSDPKRNNETIMVVSDSKDVFSFEKTSTYNGKYHVLGGLIDLSKGIEPNDLNFNSLLKRANDVKELIIATSATVEGELTAQYINSIIKSPNITTSRLGYGLPVGADLKYADQLTLIKAIENRKKY